MEIINFENFVNNSTFLVLFITMLFSWIEINFPFNEFFGSFGKFCLILSNFLLSSLLILRWLISGHFPLSNLYESLIFLSWCLNFVQLFSYKLVKTKILIVLTSPISLFIYSFATFSLPEELKKAAPLIPALQSNWLMMHVSIMIFSYAFLLIGCLVAISFLLITLFSDIKIFELYQNGINFFAITKKKLIVDNSYSSPDIFYSEKKYSNSNLLDKLDNLSYRTLSIGFFLLTLGILSGAVWANEAWGSYWSWDPKETWALITWLVFAIYLHCRLLKGWQGEKAALIGSAGFFVIWICYLGVNFLGKGLHSYGWVLN
jgi:cytochrome c-type biogenesis protein CcsB